MDFHRKTLAEFKARTGFNVQVYVCLERAVWRSKDNLGSTDPTVLRIKSSGERVVIRNDSYDVELEEGRMIVAPLPSVMGVDAESISRISMHLLTGGERYVFSR